MAESVGWGRGHGSVAGGLPPLPAPGWAPTAAAALAAAVAAVAAVVLVALLRHPSGADPAGPWVALALAPAAAAAYLTGGLVAGDARPSRAAPGQAGPVLGGLARVAAAALVAGVAESHAPLLVLLPLPALAGFRSHRRRERARAQAAADLARRAAHDALTGLPNRAHFLDRLDGAFARARRDGTAVAVLFVDLDGFKLVNDRLGHLAGDRFLAAAADRLRRAVPPGALLARYGGDEFVVLLEGPGTFREARARADALARALAGPFDPGWAGAPTTASVGVAVADRGRGSADGLLRVADAALYGAKARRAAARRALAAD